MTRGKPCGDHSAAKKAAETAKPLVQCTKYEVAEILMTLDNTNNYGQAQQHSEHHVKWQNNGNDYSSDRKEIIVQIIALIQQYQVEIRLIWQSKVPVEIYLNACLNWTQTIQDIAKLLENKLFLHTPTYDEYIKPEESLINLITRKRMVRSRCIHPVAATPVTLAVASTISQVTVLAVAGVAAIAKAQKHNVMNAVATTARKREVTMHPAVVAAIAKARKRYVMNAAATTVTTARKREVTMHPVAATARKHEVTMHAAADVTMHAAAASASAAADVAKREVSTVNGAVDV